MHPKDKSLLTQIIFDNGDGVLDTRIKSAVKVFKKIFKEKLFEPKRKVSEEEITRKVDSMIKDLSDVCSEDRGSMVREQVDELLWQMDFIFKAQGLKASDYAVLFKNELEQIYRDFDKKAEAKLRKSGKTMDDIIDEYAPEERLEKPAEKLTDVIPFEGYHIKRF